MPLTGVLTCFLFHTSSTVKLSGKDWRVAGAISIAVGRPAQPPLEGSSNTALLTLPSPIPQD